MVSTEVVEEISLKIFKAQMLWVADSICVSMQCSAEGLPWF